MIFSSDRHFYVGFGSVRRVFKRVAMSQGGFSGKGAFGSIPYLVVQYDDGQEKQCTFKREEDVDELLAYLGQVHPEIPRLSVGGEQRLAKKAQQEAIPLPRGAHTAGAERPARSWSSARNIPLRLSRADRSACRSRQGQAHQRAHKSRLPLGRAGDRPRGLRRHWCTASSAWRSGSDFGVYFALLRLCRRVLLLGSARSAHGKE